MIEITLPPYIGALCKTCETICEKECCGIRAFSFSPFNIIYHLTKINGCIRDEGVAEIRSEMAALLKNLARVDQHAEKVVIVEVNSILTVGQVISLFDLIDAALSDGCAIYAAHENQIEQSDQSFHLSSKHSSDHFWRKAGDRNCSEPDLTHNKDAIS